MMKKRWLQRCLAVIACCVVALAAALIVLPARWLMLAIPAHWPLAIVDASGSVWQGTALVALGPPGARTTLPQPLHWRAGWQNGLRLQLAHPWLGCQLALRPGLDGLGISPCSLRLPASVLATIGMPLNTIKPAGRLDLRWPGLRLPYLGGVPDGQLLTLEWADAASALSLIQPLGTYRISLHGRNNQAQITLATSRGVLTMEGSGTLHPRQGLSFSGKAQPAPQATPQQIAGLQAMLSAIGRRSGNATLLQIGR